ncbi:MAG: phosphatase PAP2 family protein [Nanoarchaeota archaeon]
MKPSKKLISLSIISLLTFILIMLGVISNYLINLDSYVNSIKFISDNITAISTIISFIFDIKSIIIISILISVFLWFKDSKKDSILFTSAMIINAGIIFIAKNLMQRQRPLNQTITETGFSFPSGHATTAMIFFGLLAYLVFKKSKSQILKISTICISVFMILFIGFTRIYLKVHWLTDVLAGFALGLFILTIAIMLRKNLNNLFH